MALVKDGLLWMRSGFDSQTRCQMWLRIVGSLLWGLFLESPETFRADFGRSNFLCIFKTKASRGTKLHSYYYFYSLYKIWKDQRYRINRSELCDWLLAPEKFSGLSRNGLLRPEVFLWGLRFSPLLKDRLTFDFIWVNFNLRCLQLVPQR